MHFKPCEGAFGGGKGFPSDGSLCGAFVFLFFKTSRVKQEVVDFYGHNTVFIILWLNNILGNDNFLEGIINLSKRSDFLCALSFVGQ